MTARPPLPPFDRESALTKVQAAEDAWNTRDPERVAGAYTVDSAWRNRDAFFTGRPAIIEFLTAKWNRELDYALRKNHDQGCRDPRPPTPAATRPVASAAPSTSQERAQPGPPIVVDRNPRNPGPALRGLSQRLS
jgi:hypothetical protein